MPKLLQDFAFVFKQKRRSKKRNLVYLPQVCESRAQNANDNTKSLKDRAILAC